MIDSTMESARVVVLNCVVGMSGPIRDHDARCFAVGFYRALGNRRSVGQALKHAVATLDAKKLVGRPCLRTRTGIDPDRGVLTSAT